MTEKEKCIAGKLYNANLVLKDKKTDARPILK